MSSSVSGYLAVVAVAVALIGAATVLAMRRPPSRTGGGPAATPSFAIWIAILVAVLLAARGSLLVAAFVILGTTVYSGIVRARAVRGGSGPGSGRG